MNREQFIDFLESYDIMLKLDDEVHNWERQVYNCDDNGLLRISKGDRDKPDMWVNILTKGHDAELTINYGVNLDYKMFKNQMNIFEILNDEIKSLNFKKYRNNIIKGEIFLKSDYETIRDIFLYSINKINELL